MLKIEQPWYCRCKNTRTRWLALKKISYMKMILMLFLAIIDADFLENDVELNAEIEEAVKNIPSVKNSTRYPCNFCDKVCLSKGGLTRHLNTKHSNENSVQKSSPAAIKPEEILHPLYFKRYLEKIATKLAANECYPVEIMDEFKKFQY